MRGRFSIKPRRAALMAAAAVAIIGVFNPVPSGAAANYVEGSVLNPGAERLHVWREAAWQTNDFLAQYSLGLEYSQLDEEKEYADIVEAYAWYFIAHNNVTVLDNFAPYADDSIYLDKWWKLQGEKHALFDQMRLDQRQDAIDRITYIIACRGAEGYLTLGDLYGIDDIQYSRYELARFARRLARRRGELPPRRSGIYQSSFYLQQEGQAQPYTLAAASQAAQPAGRSLGFLESLFSFSFGTASASSAPAPENATLARHTHQVDLMLRSLASPASSADYAPAGQPGAATGAEYYPANEAPPVHLAQIQAPAPAAPRRGFDDLPDPDNYGLTERLFQQNFLEALTFYRIAEWLGHPQARISREGLENLLLTGGIPDMSKEEAEVLITKAAFQADRWMSPYEYYPEGEMESGLKHTDECPVSTAWSDALSRVDSQLPMAYVVSALRFLGFFRGSLKEASAEFQKSIGETPTGYLNEVQKVRAIQAAALRGHAPAQNRLGVMYVKGIGVAKNFVRAEKWFELAADQQSAAANYHLSVIYSEGARGVPQDKDKATRFHVRAMAAGFRPSMREFSRLIESGARKPGGDNPAVVEPPPPK